MGSLAKNPDSRATTRDERSSAASVDVKNGCLTQSYDARTLQLHRRMGARRAQMPPAAKRAARRIGPDDDIRPPHRRVS